MSAALLVPAQAPARGLVTGYFDPAFSAARPGLFDQAADSGAGMIRLGLPWSSVAPRRPANPADPADPGYNWAQVDASLAAARNRGLQVLLSLDAVPEWAEQGPRPAQYRAGTYKPDPAAVRDFVAAVAQRYASAVRYVQLFNEPNLSNYLSPQWIKRRPFAPGRYRALLNAAYPSLHAAGIKLVTAGTAPYGDAGRSGNRIRPRIFWRRVMSRRVHFDVLAHHPYAIDGPRRRALSRNDIAVPDVHRLAAVVRAALRRGKVRPRRSKPIWVTEIGWDSNPPDPDGVPERRFTRWVGDSLYVLWKQRVSHVMWFLVRDQNPVPSFAATRQSGIFLASGEPKAAVRAFRFPFSCERRGRGTRVWVRAPAAGRVAIEDASGTVLRTLSTGADRIALATLPGRPTVHAAQAGDVSVSCRVRKG